jgi:hypothetical protein
MVEIFLLRQFSSQTFAPRVEIARTSVSYYVILQKFLHVLLHNTQREFVKNGARSDWCVRVNVLNVIFGHPREISFCDDS